MASCFVRHELQTHNYAARMSSGKHHKAALPRVFIQLPEVWGLLDPLVDYRPGFHAYVQQHAGPHDYVIIIEPNPHRAQLLRDLWAQAANVQVIVAEPWTQDDQDPIHYWMEQDAPEFNFRSPLPLTSFQRFPNGIICQEIVHPIRDIRDYLPLEKEFTIALVSADLRRLDAGGKLLDLGVTQHMLASFQSDQLPEVFSLTTEGLLPGEVASFTSVLRKFDYSPGGRLWGAAGTSKVFSRPRTLRDRLTQLAQRSRVDLGSSVVRFRDTWLSPSRRSALRVQFTTLLPGGVTPSDVLDENLASPLPALPRVEVRRLLPLPQDQTDIPWAIQISEPDSDAIAQECFDRHGIWPISFSFPREPFNIAESPEWLISPIIPGLPYAFDSEATYLDTYRRAYLGVTHRKAGWDCFRHVEILASGALPLMPDARDIPKFAMVHYPKISMARTASLVKERGSSPSDATRRAFREFFQEHLTSRAMAQYVLRTSGLDSCSRVLFVDEKLPGHADYQSVLTLIGLKQILGKHCHVMFPTDYIYQDTEYSTETLYGRGFGYTALISPDDRSMTETGAPIDFSGFDAVIIGSWARNRDLAQRILLEVPPARTIWIHGEDTPPLPHDVRDLRAFGTHVFVRSIQTSH